jgi:hypothetical protein
MSTSALPLTQNDVPAADSHVSRSTLGLSTRLIFEGRPDTFLGLLVKGALLQLPTFGFYRFW